MSPLPLTIRAPGPASRSSTAPASGRLVTGTAESIETSALTKTRSIVLSSPFFQQAMTSDRRKSATAGSSPSKPRNRLDASSLPRSNGRTRAGRSPTPRCAETGSTSPHSSAGNDDWWPASAIRYDRRRGMPSARQRSNRRRGGASASRRVAPSPGTRRGNATLSACRQTSPARNRPSSGARNYVTDSPSRRRRRTQAASRVVLPEPAAAHRHRHRYRTSPALP